jgi:hypothetical protein
MPSFVQTPCLTTSLPRPLKRATYSRRPLPSAESTLNIPYLTPQSHTKRIHVSTRCPRPSLCWLSCWSLGKNALSGREWCDGRRDPSHMLKQESDFHSLNVLVDEAGKPEKHVYMSSLICVACGCGVRSLASGLDPPSFCGVGCPHLCSKAPPHRFSASLYSFSPAQDPHANSCPSRSFWIPRASLAGTLVVRSDWCGLAGDDCFL